MNATRLILPAILSLSLAACGDAPKEPGSGAAAPPKAASPTPNEDATEVTDAQLARDAAFRPLYAAMPLTVGDVTITPTGTAKDGLRERVLISSGGHGRAHALRVWKASLYAYGDPGRAYIVEVD